MQDSPKLMRVDTRIVIEDDRLKCPKCNGELDTGFECTECGHDAMPDVEAAYPISVGTFKYEPD
jgi:hypothetical protein